MDRPSPKTLRIAAVGDLHCTKASAGAIGPLLASVNDRADVLALCGDLTDYGLLEEAQVLAKELGAVRIPMVAVLGNHDFESGTPEVVVDTLTAAGVRVLSGESVEIGGVGFTGAKGFAGGFESATLGHWGEPAIKRFVQEAIDESLKLESGLARLRTRQKVVLLHYAPVRGTLVGEPPEIFAFLGCGRLEEPLLRYRADLIFHGHAHRGSLEARTSNGSPVYNVAMPLLRRTFPEAPAYRVFELPVEEGDAAAMEQLLL